MKVSEVRDTSTSAALKPRRPSRTIHTRGHYGCVDDVEPSLWIDTSTQAPLKTQEDKATRDTQEAISAEAKRPCQQPRFMRLPSLQVSVLKPLGVVSECLKSKAAPGLFGPWT